MANFSEQVTGIIKGYIGQYLQVSCAGHDYRQSKQLTRQGVCF
jgi:hypothetical protein